MLYTVHTCHILLYIVELKHIQRVLVLSPCSGERWRLCGDSQII